MAKKAIDLSQFSSDIKRAIITVKGDSDLVLNKMNERSKRWLMAEDRKGYREVPNKWEDIITAIHWKTPVKLEDTKKECTEELMYKLLEENAPCLTGFGFKRSWKDAVMHNEFANDKYGKKFFEAINIVAEGDKIPIRFTSWEAVEKLMSPKRGAPVLVQLNHFIGWEADIEITYSEHVYSLEQILKVITMAGFGVGIGSGRTTGYGRYHIIGVAAEQ